MRAMDSSSSTAILSPETNKNAQYISKKPPVEVPSLTADGKKAKKKPLLTISTEKMVAHVQTPDQKSLQPVSAPLSKSAAAYSVINGQRKHGLLRTNTTSSPCRDTYNHGGHAHAHTQSQSANPDQRAPDFTYQKND